MRMCACVCVYYINVMSRNFEELIDTVLRIDEKHHSDTYCQCVLVQSLNEKRSFVALFCWRSLWNAVWCLHLTYWFTYVQYSIFDAKEPLKSIRTVLSVPLSFLPPFIHTCTHLHIFQPSALVQKKHIHYTLINTASLLNHFMWCCCCSYWCYSTDCL